MDYSINAHIITWFLAFILFFAALALFKSGKARAEKVILMILRLFYLLIIATGLHLLMSIAFINFDYILKLTAGLWVIAMWEMILARVHKGKKTAVFWFLLIMSFVVALFLGYSLPLGYKFF